MLHQPFSYCTSLTVAVQQCDMRIAHPHSCVLAQCLSEHMPWTKACVCMLQLGWPSMRIPILVTMAWPERLPCSDDFTPRLDFVKMGNLTFKAPDDAKYPAMQLAYSAGRAGGTMTGVLSAANEQASLCKFRLPRFYMVSYDLLL